jgi:hypothetical protein
MIDGLKNIFKEYTTMYEVTIPNIGNIHISTIPEGYTVEWNNTVYVDGHKEGTIYKNDNDVISYSIVEL